MLKKNKKGLLLASGLFGVLTTSAAAAIALSSCSTTSSSTTPAETEEEYTTSIDWSIPSSYSGLTKDNQGVYYSDESKTNVVAIDQSLSSSTITLPASVTTISGYNKLTTSNGTKAYEQAGAFQGNTNITTITLAPGSKLTKIGQYAFKGCTSLTGISDTSGLTSIGTSAFEGCTSLTSFSLNKIQKIWDSAFSGCTAFNGAVELSNTVSIGASAFLSTKITTIDASKNSRLTSIGDNAFKDCTLLSKVTIPSEGISKLKTIGASAFSGCTSLATFGPQGTADGSLISTTSMGVVGTNAFENTNITTVNLSRFTVTQTKYLGDSRILYGTGSNGSFKNMHHVTSFTLPEGIQRLSGDNDGTGYFTGVGDQGSGIDLVLPSSIVDFYVWTNDQLPKSSPFIGSGIKSINMSKISGYDVNSANRMVAGIFYGATKLETVILKPNTPNIANYAFQKCSSLKWVKNPTSKTDTTALTTNGFTASSVITSIGTSAFDGAFAENSDLTIDLSEAKINSISSYAFQNTKITSLKLPSTITTINDDAFANTTKLSSVNFTDLTSLTRIGTKNFSNSLLTEIDLSNTQFKSLGSGAFTGLDTSASVSFPTTLTGNFSNAFQDKENKYIKFNFPNGMNSSYYTINTDGVLSLTKSATTVLDNISNTNLATATTATSVGANTFFGKTKLEKVTLSAKSITSSTSIFTASNISSPSENKNQNPDTYVAANLPFGSNTAFTSLNYSGFATNEASATATTTETLFETTSQSTWDAVAKIINSLSNYSYQSSDTASNGSKLPTNLSEWRVESTETGASKINTDSTIKFTAASSSVAAKLTIGNVYKNASDASTSDPAITSSTTTATFVHNGITWKYTNDGTNITLAGQANMYKATNGSTSFLTFFNTQSQANGSSTYIIPSQTKITVNLVIATKAAA